MLSLRSARQIRWPCYQKIPHRVQNLTKSTQQWHAHSRRYSQLPDRNIVGVRNESPSNQWDWNSLFWKLSFFTRVRSLRRLLQLYLLLQELDWHSTFATRRHDLLKSVVSNWLPSPRALPLLAFLNSLTRFFTEEKERGLKSYGRPQIGGPFSLTTHDNKPFTQENLLGKWSLVYFGFTNCPDICPAELDKVTAVLDNIRTPSSSIIEAFETNMSNRERARRYISTRLHFRRPSSRYSIPYRSIPERFPRFLHRPRWRIRRY